MEWVNQQQAINNVVMFALIAECSSEQQDLLLNLKLNKEIDNFLVKKYLVEFLT